MKSRGSLLNAVKATTYCPLPFKCWSTWSAQWNCYSKLWGCGHQICRLAWDNTYYCVGLRIHFQSRRVCSEHVQGKSNAEGRSPGNSDLLQGIQYSQLTVDSPDAQCYLCIGNLQLGCAHAGSELLYPAAETDLPATVSDQVTEISAADFH